MAQEIEATEPDDQDDVGMSVDNPTGPEDSTALIPTNFFQGKELKPGSQCLVKISRVLDGQVEVTYVPHDEESEPGEESEDVGDAEMSGYMDA